LLRASLAKLFQIPSGIGSDIDLTKKRSDPGHSNPAEIAMIWFRLKKVSGLRVIN
jgi:hypothetical protein